MDEPEVLARYSIPELVRLSGAQGAEFILWLTMRGALGNKVKMIHSNYHVAISNTATALMVFEKAA